MLGEPVAFLVVNAARMKLALAHVRLQERLVIITGHETDLLAVHLVRRLEPELAGDRADLRLLHPAERAHRALELRLPETE